MNKIEALSVVLFLVLQQRKEINAIWQTKYKRIGSYHIALTNKEKAEQVKRVHDRYNRQINKVYSQLNVDLKNHGHEPLINPFVFCTPNAN